jgi:hypothetical protein
MAYQCLLWKLENTTLTHLEWMLYSFNKHKICAKILHEVLKGHFPIVLLSIFPQTTLILLCTGVLRDKVWCFQMHPLPPINLPHLACQNRKILLPKLLIAALLWKCMGAIFFWKKLLKFMEKCHSVSISYLHERCSYLSHLIPPLQILLKLKQSKLKREPKPS